MSAHESHDVLDTYPLHSRRWYAHIGQVGDDDGRLVLLGIVKRQRPGWQQPVTDVQSLLEFLIEGGGFCLLTWQVVQEPAI